MQDQVKDQIAEFIKQTERMQEDLKQIQEKLTKTEVTGNSETRGLVSIKLTCKYRTRPDGSGIMIDDNLLSVKDKQKLLKSIAEAINNAANEIEKIVQQKMDSVTSNLKVPSRLHPPPL